MKHAGGFTLLELMIVLVIITILATMGASQYNASKEKALDNEAKANLRLIMAAERMYRMEDNRNPPQFRNCANTAAINQDLRLALTTDPVTASWDYSVTCASATYFCAQADRRKVTPRHWNIVAPSGGSDPQPADGTCPATCP